jgi:hypothetical protein
VSGKQLCCLILRQAPDVCQHVWFGQADTRSKLHGLPCVRKRSHGGGFPLVCNKVSFDVSDFKYDMEEPSSTGGIVSASLTLLGKLILSVIFDFDVKHPSDGQAYIYIFTTLLEDGRGDRFNSRPDTSDIENVKQEPTIYCFKLGVTDGKCFGYPYSEHYFLVLKKVRSSRKVRLGDQTYERIGLRGFTNVDWFECKELATLNIV